MGGDDTSPPELTDADGDGFFLELTDCDDADATVFPGAEEVCNGLDDNCDGDIDEGVTSIFYVDGDGDGYGTNEEVEGCEVGSGLSDNRLDCNDEDPEIYFGALEVCDGIDNDCDQLVDTDDEDVDLSSAPLWYTDLDSDGWGDDTSTASACEQPAGMAAQGGDCDELRASVNPGATELCDGLDTDCDGSTPSDEQDDDADGFRSCDGDCDDGEDTVYDGATELCDGLDNDCSGAVGEDEVDGDGDGYVACEVTDGWYGSPIDGGGDCDDDDGDEWPGADETCDGDDDDCDGQVDEASAIDVSTWYADTDGDGYGDATVSTIACDAPSGSVADSTDCDDTDGDVNPAGTEVCDGVDNDCDSATSEEGTVAFTDSTGAVSDVSTSWSTSSSTVSAVTLTDEGEVSFCDGTYYANVTIEADVSLVGANGDATLAVLDGGDSGNVVVVETDSLAVSIEDVTLQSGSATSTYSTFTVGGGVSCSANSTLDMTRVVVDGNEAEVGGGVFIGDDCVASFDSVDITGNDADNYGGGVAVTGDLTLTDSAISDNVCNDYGGGGLVLGGSVTLDGTLVDDNLATYGGGWAISNSGSLECIGTASTSDGFTNNSDDLGAILLESGSISADVCDFGTSAGGDDNDPADIYTSLGNLIEVGDDETFECADGLCAAGTFSVGGSTATLSSNLATGAVFTATSNGKLTSIGAYVGGGCAMDYWILMSSSTSGGWTQVHTDSASSTSAGWNDVTVDVNVSKGLYYAVLVAWETCNMDAYSGASTSTDVGFGTLYGSASQGTYGGGAPLSISTTSTSTVPAVRMDVSL